MAIMITDECINCGACEPECPVEAIFEDDDVPEKWTDYTELNAKVCEDYTDDELNENRVTSKE